MTKSNRIYFLVALLLVFPACSSDLPEPSADFYAKQGWQQYQLGLYEEAQKNFELAQKLDQDSVDAAVGLGWIFFRQSEDPQTMEMAKGEFEKAVLLAKQDDNTDLLDDAHAGLAGVNLSLERYQEAIRYAELIVDPNYRFARGQPNFGSKELTLLLAICYFHIGDYEKSVEKIQVLNPKFSWQLDDEPSKILKELERQ